MGYKVYILYIILVFHAEKKEDKRRKTKRAIFCHRSEV